MTDYYVNTISGGSGNDGLSPGTAWDSIVTAYANIPAGDHTLYCSGGADQVSTTFYSNATNWTSLAIIGELDTLDFATYSKYRIRAIGTLNVSGFTLLADKNITLSQILIDCTAERGASLANNQPVLALSGAGPGVCRADRCAVIADFDGSTTAPHAVVLNTSGTAEAYFTNSVVVQSGAVTSANIRTIFIDGSQGTKLTVANVLADVRTTGTATNGQVGGFSGDNGNPNAACYNVIGWRSNSTDDVNNFRYLGGGTNNACNGAASNTDPGFQATTGIADSVYAAAYPNYATLDFTPADPEQGPAAFYQQGTDVSSITGITHDFFGVERVAPWDIGPIAYVALNPHPGSHTVTDISQAADPECIYFGQAPAIQVGDLFSFKETTETNGWGVSIDAQGFPIIDSGGGTGTDSFLFNISRDGGSTWDPTPPASDSWLFAVAPTLSSPTVVATETDGATLSIDTNSSAGRLYLAVRTLAQGGAYGPAEQVAIRDGVIGVDCEFKDSLLAPSDVAPNQFVVSGLDPSTDYYFGFAQDADAV